MSTMHLIHIGVKKAASFYYRLDEGGIDQEKNPIKTIQLSKDLKVYAPNKKDVLYTYKREILYQFIY